MLKKFASPQQASGYVLTEVSLSVADGHGLVSMQQPIPQANGSPGAPLYGGESPIPAEHCDGALFSALLSFAAVRCPHLHRFCSHVKTRHCAATLPAADVAAPALNVWSVIRAA